MNNARKTEGTIQSTKVSKSSKKQDVNLRKNSIIYFQIGLIICLFAAYSLLEMEVLQAKVVVESWPVEETSVEVALNEVQVERMVPKKAPEPKSESTQVINEIKVITENDPAVETLFTQLSQPEKPVVSIESITVVEEEEEFNIISVQKVPVFPGCEKFSLREDLTKCMSDRIGKLVRKKFDTDIASENGLSGLQRIMVQFKIDSDGIIKDIKTRAPHPELENEATRVIHKLPQMQPGFQGDKPVPVIYTLPIKFMVRD